jgi:hypothetical protein
MTQPSGDRRSSQYLRPRPGSGSEPIPTELVKKIADEVYALLQADLKIQNERSRSQPKTRFSTSQGGR